MMCSVLTLNIGNLRGVTVASAAGVRGAKCVGALVCQVDLENEECEIAYPNLLFGRNIFGGHGVTRSGAPR